MKNEVSPIVIGAAIIGVLVVAFIGFQLFARQRPTGLAYTPSAGGAPPPPAIDRASFYRGGNTGERRQAGRPRF